MKAEPFNDARLIELAKSHFYNLSDEAKRKPEVAHIQKLLASVALTNGERNQLLNFIYANKYTKPVSMSVMRNELLRMAGSPPVNDKWRNTVSSAELTMIYNYVKGLQK